MASTFRCSVLHSLAALSIAVAAAGTFASSALAEVETIAQAVEQVRQMRSQGANNAQIAQLVSGIVDQRITNVNDIRLPDSEQAIAESTAEGEAAIARWEHEREDFGLGIKQNFGNEYAVRAEWAWNLRYGACNETACIAYHILKEAGIQNVRLMEVPVRGNGHDYVVMGLDGGGQAGDISTWGRDAMVVDGWLGRGFTPHEAQQNEWLAGDNSESTPGDITSNYDSPKIYDIARRRVQGNYKSKLEEARGIQVFLNTRTMPLVWRESENGGSEIPGTWTYDAARQLLTAKWNNGASAVLTLERFDHQTIVVTRSDTEGTSRGLTARYEGTRDGNTVKGTVTWNWNGNTWSGTWNASW